MVTVGLTAKPAVPGLNRTPAICAALPVCKLKILFRVMVKLPALTFGFRFKPKRFQPVKDAVWEIVFESIINVLTALAIIPDPWLFVSKLFVMDILSIKLAKVPVILMPWIPPTILQLEMLILLFPAAETDVLKLMLAEAAVAVVVLKVELIYCIKVLNTPLIIRIEQELAFAFGFVCDRLNNL